MHDGSHAGGGGFHGGGGSHGGGFHYPDVQTCPSGWLQVVPNG